MKITQLEALRGMAAIYVMMSHLSSNELRLQQSWIGQPFRFAQEGVLVFFLLSGFVIYYSWHEYAGPKNFGIFAYKRFRRIYPIFLLALLLTYAVNCVGKGFQPLNLPSLLGNVLMFQGLKNDAGLAINPFMDNGPLWSLSYEWWFYMMFYPIYRFVPSDRQRLVVFGLALIGFVGQVTAPNIAFHILASFPIWWCGVEFAREHLDSGRFTWRKQKAMIAMLFFFGVIYVPVVWAWIHHGGRVSSFHYPIVCLRHYAFSILLVLIFFAWKKVHFKGFACTIGPFQIFAGLSYALYLLHYPIICDLPLVTAPSLWYLNLLAKLVLCLTLAYLVEEVGQKYVSRGMDRFLQRWLPGFLEIPKRKIPPAPAIDAVP
jgi:peptidoglycan/LPS O-acetylase OafA/YrhL